MCIRDRSVGVLFVFSAEAEDEMGDGAALGRVLALSLNGDGVLAEDIQVAFGVGLLLSLIHIWCR